MQKAGNINTDWRDYSTTQLINKYKKGCKQSYHLGLKVIVFYGNLDNSGENAQKKELEMAKVKKNLNKWYITRYSKEKERIFLFYAAVAMSIFYGYCRLF